MEFDLDAVRAARAEKKQEPRTVMFGGRQFTMAAELPYNFTALTDDAALDILFGDDADAFRALGPSTQDMQDLMLGILPFYGFGNLGESPASRSSSSNGSKPLRRTSKRTTA